MSTYNEYRGCRHPGCVHQAERMTGVCRTHYNDPYQATSDGRSSGSKPKLTSEQVAEARRMRAAFKTNRDIAKHFGVSLDTLRKYLRS